MPDDLKVSCHFGGTAAGINKIHISYMNLSGIAEQGN